MGVSVGGCSTAGRGWQCTVHAVGDKAIEQTLDAMARAQAEHPREGLRHVGAHLLRGAVGVGEAKRGGDAG